MSTGLEDLLRRFQGEQPRLALLLVKATIGPVVSGLADAYGMAPLLEEASVKVAAGGSLQASGWMAAVQLRDEPWVCVYVALEEVSGLDQELARQVAADLSDTLSTEAAAIVIAPQLLTSAGAAQDDTEADVPAPGEHAGEPEETWVSFELFSGGEVEDLARWRVDGPVDVFDCRLREAPEEGQPVGLDLVSRLAADRGIYVAACCPRGRNDQAHLDVWDPDPSGIQRADLFRLRGSSFFDDETLEMTLDEVDEPPEDEASDGDLGSAAGAADEEGAGAESGDAAPRTGGLRGIFRRFIGRE